MLWIKRLLGTQLLIALPAAAYNLTRYFQPSVKIYTKTYLTPPEVASYTTSAEITLTGTETPSIITAKTRSDSTYTEVEALVPTGYGKEVDWVWLDRPKTEYYVEVTLTKCLERGRVWLDPITSTMSVGMPRGLTGYLSPTSVVGETAILGRSDVDPRDLASASYYAYPGYPTECSRVLSTVDYRSLCNTWFRPTTSQKPSRTSTEVASQAHSNLAPDRDDISCGELNPCCWGCHAWATSYLGYLPQDADFYICEDGRYLFVNGSEIDMTGSWEAKEKAAREANSTSQVEPKATGSVHQGEKDDSHAGMVALPGLLALLGVLLVSTIL